MVCTLSSPDVLEFLYRDYRKRKASVERVMKNKFFFYSWRHSPLRTRAYLPAADITSTCPVTEMKDHWASLGLTCGQHIEFSRRCGFLYRDHRKKQNLLKSLTILGWQRSHTLAENSSPNWESNHHRIPQYEVKSPCFSPRDHGNRVQSTIVSNNS